MHDVDGRGARDQAVVDLDHVVGAVLAHPGPATGQVHVPLPGAPAQPVVRMGRFTGHRFDGHLDVETGQPDQLLVDNVRLQ